MKFKTKPGCFPRAKFKDFEGDILEMVLSSETAVITVNETVGVAMPIKKLRKLAKSILKEIGE